jgi:hypothetical protein
MGVAFGAKNSTVPIFSAGESCHEELRGLLDYLSYPLRSEIAPARVRGGLVMGWQLCESCGNSQKHRSWTNPIGCLDIVRGLLWYLLVSCPPWNQALEQQRF